MFGNPYGGDPYAPPYPTIIPSRPRASRFPMVTDYRCRHTLIPPRGYNICGVTGSCGAWLDGFSVIITK